MKCNFLLWNSSGGWDHTTNVSELETTALNLKLSSWRSFRSETLSITKSFQIKTQKLKQISSYWKFLAASQLGTHQAVRLIDPVMKMTNGQLALLLKALNPNFQRPRAESKEDRTLTLSWFCDSKHWRSLFFRLNPKKVIQRRLHIRFQGERKSRCAS